METEIDDPASGEDAPDELVSEDFAGDLSPGDLPGDLDDDLDDVPAPVNPPIDATIVVLGVPESARQQLVRAGARVFDLLPEDLGSAETADVIVVSTRVPRGQCQSIVSALMERSGQPIVALAHAGGEASAVEIMRAGGTAVVAEGNEDALRAFLADDDYSTPLAETYETQVGRRRSQDLGGRAKDPVTNLPAAAGFEARLREIEQTGEPMRIGFLRVLNFDQTARRLAFEATGILRRRLAAQYQEVARLRDIELFSLGPADFAFVAPALDPEGAERLGRELARFTESFSPTVHGPLGLAMGHAGQESGSEVGGLRELAQRAVGVAAVQEGSAVVSAEELSRTLTSTTELEVALRLLFAIERHDPAGPSHGTRVAGYAAELAQRLGFEGTDRAHIRFAAHLHDIGKIGLPVAAMFDQGSLDEEALAAYRSHPERGERYLRISAGRQIAVAIRAHHEHWDGSGFPDGLAGIEIPVAARIIVVADAWDRMATQSEGGAPPPETIIAALREAAGTRFDPSVVDAAVELLEQAVTAGDEAGVAS
ncbi:MAG: HD domain-containing phosphohydrolase [Candidatus Rokuibacteriota bacterium]